jgi:hypothetical protein
MRLVELLSTACLFVSLIPIRGQFPRLLLTMTGSYEAVKVLVQNVTNSNNFCVLAHQTRGAYAQTEFGEWVVSMSGKSLIVKGFSGTFFVS